MWTRPRLTSVVPVHWGTFDLLHGDPGSSSSRASNRAQPDSKHTAALHAFVAALVEHGDLVGEDEHGRVVMQVAVEPWIFDTLGLLGADTADMKPEDA